MAFSLGFGHECPCMHLQINLSNQLIKQWKPVLTENPPETHPLLQWRIDKMKLDRSSANYICVNEATLFSFLLPLLPGKSEIKIQQYFVNRVRSLMQMYFFPPAAFKMFDCTSVLFGKSTCKRMVGSITSMRYMYETQYFMETPLPLAEKRVNTSPKQGPNCRYPMGEFLMLRDLFEYPDGNMITFQMPCGLVYAARRAFLDDEPPALSCFDSTSETDENFTARLTFEDLFVLHDQILDLLDKSPSPEIKADLILMDSYLRDELPKRK